MKKFFAPLALAAAFESLLISLQPALAQGTAFTYQGQLNNNGVPANGSYDVKFALFDAASNGNQVGGAVTNLAVGITSGQFTTAIDFGPGIFTGNALWLEIHVRSNGAGAYTALSPLQELNPTPYSVFATLAGDLTGTLSAGRLAGGVISTSLLPGFQGSDNAIGGGQGNIATGIYESIGGGFYNTNIGNYATVGGGALNQATGQGAVVGGGGFDGNNISGNTASGAASTIAGGIGNMAESIYATVSGGFYNMSSGAGASVGGGEYNTASGQVATVAGGTANRSSGGGGYDGTSYVGNTASGAASSVAGGHDNSAVNIYATSGQLQQRQFSDGDG